MKFLQYIFLTALLLAFNGCATKVISFVSAGTPAIILKESQKVGYWIGDNAVEFPSGVYQPDFQSQEGIYYRTPTRLIASNSLDPLGPMIKRGGIFIPFPASKDQRHGVWFDHQDASPSVITLAVTSPKKVWRLKQQIVFEEPSP
jgi:hypothetical protein